MQDGTAVLLIDCPDRKGLVASVSGLLYAHGANIIHADQHQDHEAGLFFMRVEWSLEGFEVDPFRAEFEPIAAGFGMRWRLEMSDRVPRVAIFASHELHCLVDLLYRHQTGEFRCDIPLIIGNHRDAESLAGFYNCLSHFLPTSKESKQEVERKQLALLRDAGVRTDCARAIHADPVTGVRERYPGAIINVHHSFLPAFIGAKPYHQAFERGVKLIGSTSHYVTAGLDDGPIIEQDVMRVSHRDQVKDLVEKGRDLERIVLSRAVRWHLEHRILRYANKTVVFD